MYIFHIGFFSLSFSLSEHFTPPINLLFTVEFFSFRYSEIDQVRAVTRDDKDLQLCDYFVSVFNFSSTRLMWRGIFIQLKVIF